MNYLSPTEEDVLDYLIMLKSALLHTSLVKADYTVLMAMLRDIIKGLENRKYGCSTGVHAGACFCKGTVKGLANYGHTKKRG